MAPFSKYLPTSILIHLIINIGQLRRLRPPYADIRESDIEPYRKQFERLDANGSGVLTAADLARDTIHLGEKVETAYEKNHPAKGRMTGGRLRVGVHVPGEQQPTQDAPEREA